MSSELQPSLAVTLPSGEIDGHMMMLFAVMLFAGILGGAANYYLNEKDRPSRPQDWAKYPVFGVVAALTVPLFLNMISSTLMEAARVRPMDLFVFAGFCLIYVIASRNLFGHLLHRLLGQVDAVQRELTDLRQKQAQAQAAAVAAKLEASAAAPAAVATPPRPADPDPQKVMTYQDVEILRALSESQYVCGNLVALCDTTNLSRDFVSQRLTTLKNLGVIDTRISDKNVLHWVLSPSGKAVLDEILAGTEARRVA